MIVVNGKCRLEDLDEALCVVEIVKQEAKHLESGMTSQRDYFSYPLHLLLNFILKEIETLKETQEKAD